jgi:alkylation response protein AidB-like acyl-CoA dehydrogenase
MASPDEEFRDELRGWLTEHAPPAVDVAATADDAGTLREWQRTLHAGRWVGVHWPVEYGGRGASLTQVAIYNEELARAGAPPLLGRAGITLVGPTLMAHGAEPQRVRWMPRILGADDVWCQLFSEPGAGSDLAGLSTRATKSGGVYRVSGQKVWSSYATFADMGIALVRTDPDAPPHKGISMLAIPMNTKGVEVRPLRQMTGESEFNEVFLEDVAVPVENLIGPENEGWRVANTTLATSAARRSSGRSRSSCAPRSTSSRTPAPTAAVRQIRGCVSASRVRGSTSRSSGSTTRAHSRASNAVRRSAPSRVSSSCSGPA